MKLKTFLLEDYYDKHEFSTPFLLSQSDCESMTIEELLFFGGIDTNAFLQTPLSYTESKGNPQLREMIGSLYHKCNGDNVLVHVGAEEAIYNFMHVFLNPGDHMIFMSPAYQSLYEIANGLKCEVSPWKLQQQPEGGWHLDIDMLLALIKPNTKLLIINTPHNPTGYALTDAQLLEIANIAEKHHIFIFCDQVYKGLEWDNEKHAWMSDLYENALSLGVMSKAYGLAGLRIGWIATQNAALFDEMVKYKYYTSICNAAPSEYLAMIALQNSETILERNLSIVKENLKYSEGFFAKHQDRILNNRPMAGPIAFHKLLGKTSIGDFCADLIEKKGVLLLPGDVYEDEGNYFRMGYSRSNFKKSVDLLDEYLDER